MVTYVFNKDEISPYTKYTRGDFLVDAEIVGRVIQRVREDRKQSQELVSGLAGIGRTHLSAIERGARKPTLDTFVRIAEAMGIRPSMLLAEIELEMEK